MHEVSDILLYRINPALNENRFYRLLLLPCLFDGAQVMREFGRIGHPGRIMIQTYEHRVEALKNIERLTKQKLKRGYRMRHMLKS